MCVCRLTFFDFIYKEFTPNGYDKDDLIDGINYAQELINQGYKKEPHDEFNLIEYQNWCKEKIINRF